MIKNQIGNCPKHVKSCLLFRGESSPKVGVEKLIDFVFVFFFPRVAVCFHFFRAGDDTMLWLDS